MRDSPRRFFHLAEATYRQLRTVFQDVAGFTPSPVNFGAQGRPERVWAEIVTGNYFSMQGLEAVPGRMFAPDKG
jgi:hypothetical protein